MNAVPGVGPEPDDPVFESYVRVRFHEIDALGHVNNAAYLNYLEQAAIDHAQSLGLGLETLRELGGVFLARRHEITFLKPSFAGEILRIVTWLADPRGARVDRHYRVFRDNSRGPDATIAGRITSAGDRVFDGDLVTSAMTEWVFANALGQPRRIPGEIIAVFRSGLSAKSDPTPYE